MRWRSQSKKKWFKFLGPLGLPILGLSGQLIIGLLDGLLEDPWVEAWALKSGKSDRPGLSQATALISSGRTVQPCRLETPNPNKSFFIGLFDQFCSKKFEEENFLPLKTCNRSHVR